MSENNYEALLYENLDILREIGNIGMGHAATALSQMLGMKVTMTIPEVYILSKDGVLKYIKELSVDSHGVRLGLQADSQGIIFQILTKSFAIKVINFFFQSNLEAINDLDEMSLSVIQEIGNITSGAYCNSLASMTGLFIDISPPSHCPDMPVAVEEESVRSNSDLFLVINNSFFIDNEEIKSNFLFLPDSETTGKILTKLKEYYGFTRI